VKNVECLQTQEGAGSAVIWSDLQTAVEYLDPFQVLGIGACGAHLLDDPNEPDMENYEP
jgi:hypothetical protein